MADFNQGVKLLERGLAGLPAGALPTTPFAPRVAGTLKSHFNRGADVPFIAASVSISDAAVKGVTWPAQTSIETERNDAPASWIFA
jgi:hypothetical protein